MIFLKQIFLGKTKFGEHKKLGCTAPNNPRDCGHDQKTSHSKSSSFHQYRISGNNIYNQFCNCYIKFKILIYCILQKLTTNPLSLRDFQVNEGAL